VDFRIRFQPSGRAVRVGAGTSLLEAVQRAGLPIASACGGESLCGRCGVSVLSGANAIPCEDETEERAKRRNRVPAQQRLACRVAVSGDLEVTASYW
jgi:ferredoxin